ncbi:MAG: archaeal proteasome endopeptidase complex subunit alpha [Candidatus Poseidoniales archaeon]|jgi:proteasome alpha subunit|tara:strand:+ start:158 stop:871 length:714 start_codon:yes stop_codon:yes gene_type:complete
MQPSGRGYDHGVSTFSPDGRLYQVEYARESVKRGTTTVGLKYKDGAVLIVDKRIANKLVITDSIEKMYQIDDHIGMTTSGLVADARQLVDKARVQCQINRMTFGSAISMITLVKKMCDYKQSFTQYGGARPFGTALLIAGVDDDGVHLFETDPSGAYQSYQAGAIGRGRSTVIDHFEKSWKKGMTQNAAIKLGLEALQESLEDNLNYDTVEISIVDSNGYQKLDHDTTLKHLSKVSK